jgi:hypothetical protein
MKSKHSDTMPSHGTSVCNRQSSKRVKGFAVFAV